MQSDKPALIRCARIWREDTGDFAPGAILVRSGRIADLSAIDEPAPEGADIIDLGGNWLMPGLINTHVHLEFSAGADPLATFYAESAAERLLRAGRNAREMLLSGVTTIRDCGSSWTMLALERRPDLHPALLPRIKCSGPPITPPAGHLHFMHGIAEGADDIRDHIAMIEREGGSSVKVMASGGGMTPGSDPAMTVFSQEHLNLIATLARRRGLPTAAHVLATESMRRSALAGFDSLEHCAFHQRNEAGRLVRIFDSGVAATVRDSGAHLMANLSTATRIFDAIRARAVRSDDEAHDLAQFDTMVANLGRMREVGIPVVCGSDAGVRETPFEETWREIMWLQRAGMSPVETIRSATIRAATVLRIADETGAIRPGLSADLTAIGTDPQAHEDAFRDIAFVMMAGRIVRSPNAAGNA